MGQLVLTRNIVLLMKCSEEPDCDAKEELSIEDLRDFGEPNCNKCSGFMMIANDALIKN